jgi:hypothetical protein
MRSLQMVLRGQITRADIVQKQREVQTQSEVQTPSEVQTQREAAEFARKLTNAFC